VQIAQNPGILKAVNPLYGVELLASDPVEGFVLLGAVVLAVTGAEALYADMGHFGRAPIRRAWFYFVFPCLLLNYFGQGVLLLANPETLQNPFYYLAPGWAVFPLVALASAATVIASQAVISGAFSLSRQAVQLGYLPRRSAEGLRGRLVPADRCLGGIQHHGHVVARPSSAGRATGARIHAARFICRDAAAGTAGAGAGDGDLHGPRPDAGASRAVAFTEALQGAARTRRHFAGRYRWCTACQRRGAARDS